MHTGQFAGGIFLIGVSLPRKLHLVSSRKKKKKNLLETVPSHFQFSSEHLSPGYLRALSPGVDFTLTRFLRTRFLPGHNFTHCNFSWQTTPPRSVCSHTPTRPGLTLRCFAECLGNCALVKQLHHHSPSQKLVSHRSSNGPHYTTLVLMLVTIFLYPTFLPSLNCIILTLRSLL